MQIPIPAALAAKISADAVKNAREAMKGFGWSEKSLQALQPKPGEGAVGIQTTQKYLIFQEKGTEAFLMHWVAGRTLPLGCAQGDGPHFRRGGHVGEPGYVTIPHRGKVWRDQRWRHPGLKPRNFMRDGLNKAIQDNQPAVQAWANSLLKGGRA
jgi:hypothetical protein